MDALRGITQQINVFVRFFESINYLFCQVRWLEQNIQNSSQKLILIVLVLAMIGGFVWYCSTIPEGNDNLLVLLSRMMVAYFPIIAVVLLIGYLLVRRFSNSSEGELGGGNGFQNVFFGSSRGANRSENRENCDVENRRHPGLSEGGNSHVYNGIPTAPPAPFGYR
mmetsp:Transcript_29758/g.28455  ORF Transcript_29758/g.28455 Transcript_29758/m.28455 type:complete len:166 (+) Transcript_29758:240-737(+)